MKSDRNIGYFTLRPVYTYGKVSLNYSSNEKCFREKSYRKSKHVSYVQ